MIHLEQLWLNKIKMNNKAGTFIIKKVMKGILSILP